MPGSTHAWHVHAGKNGLGMAVDTPDVSATGHVSEFLEETVLMQIPTADGLFPLMRYFISGLAMGRSCWSNMGMERSNIYEILVFQDGLIVEKVNFVGDVTLGYDREVGFLP